ncbi:MAG: CRISPR-associated protein Cas4 [Terracidiphilus sp.]|nr:CRISPR-associated protein Cas4 [Terracidiphilus sp.]
MYGEDDLLPLSGLQHLMFCERQWALIHLEQQWEENRLTAEGRLLHEAAHTAGTESRGPVRIARGLALRSLRLGLAGQADVVEFHGHDPFPVEYKRGKPKSNRCDEIQLCAQALCLEEMLAVSIPAGALFYGTTRRRTDVAFDAALRTLVEDLAGRMHTLYRLGKTPEAVYAPRCEQCSLMELCLPRRTRSASRYLRDRLRQAMEEPSA